MAAVWLGSSSGGGPVAGLEILAWGINTNKSQFHLPSIYHSAERQELVPEGGQDYADCQLEALNLTGSLQPG